MTDRRHAGVMAPPPLLFFIALAAGFALQAVAPLGFLASIPAAARWVVGGVLIAAAIAVNAQGFLRFVRLGTPVIPYKEPTRLVTDGVYAHVRNPMYLGMILFPVGLGLGLANAWLIACAAVLWAVLHYGVVRREERYLEELFGEDYRVYKSRVPPYGWRF